MPPRLDFYYTNYTALGSRSLFIPNTHNVIIMVWLRIILHDAACMSGQNLNEKAVKVWHFFVSFTQVFSATRCPYCPQPHVQYKYTVQYSACAQAGTVEVSMAGCVAHGMAVRTTSL